MCVWAFAPRAFCAFAASHPSDSAVWHVAVGFLLFVEVLCMPAGKLGIVLEREQSVARFLHHALAGFAALRLERGAFQRTRRRSLSRTWLVGLAGLAGLLGCRLVGWLAGWLA